ncbi:MAG: hypothetical protein KDC24_12050, partial [Saprospiraceae bacterium]|nr:hypothetical protein [Saprospiraceae bacterium]
MITFPTKHQPTCIYQVEAIGKRQPVTEYEIIQGCKNQDRKAQKALYDRYAPVMYGVCLRYM